jgi:hypothetical protein
MRALRTTVSLFMALSACGGSSGNDGGTAGGTAGGGAAGGGSAGGGSAGGSAMVACSAPGTRSTCTYGMVCTFDTVQSASFCQKPPECSGSFAPATTAALSPIIYDVARKSASSGVAGICSGGAYTSFSGSFYDPDDDFAGPPGNVFYTTATAAPGYPATAGNADPTGVSLSSTSPEAGIFSFTICDSVKSTTRGVFIVDTAKHVSNTVCLPSF